MDRNNNNSSSSSSSHLHVQGDDVPPPPYSETDIYSNPGSAPLSATPASHNFADDAASSTTSDVIFTPPLTPHLSSSSPRQPSAQQSGAAFYFESRPPPSIAFSSSSSSPSHHSAPTETLIHSVNVHDASLPEEFPYQGDWVARDVTAQDWATFINYLLPDHTARSNEAVLHMKLQKESNSDSASMSSGMSQVGAKLEQARDATPAISSPSAAQRRRDIEATVQEWNDGFFGPRGINVRLEPLREPLQDQPASQARMPGSWDVPPDQRDPSASLGERDGARQGRNNAWRAWGDLHIDDNSIRYGNTFVADQNGLRIGNLVMDQRGIRFEGDRPGQQSGVTAPGPSVGQPMPPASAPPYSREAGHDVDREVRGRRVHHFEGGKGKQKCERSPSISSVSSVSSSSSESSIGSLPDYDSIPHQAVPLYISRVKSWISQPEQIRTKGDVKQLKAELKSVAKSRDLPPGTSADTKIMKVQVKALTVQWKQIKRQQKRDHRERKRERREMKKTQRMLRRQRKKEMKRAMREGRRGFHPPPSPPPPPPTIAPPFPPMPLGPPGLSNPAMPPPIPSHPMQPLEQPSHPMYSVPPVPPIPPFGGGCHSGRGRGRGSHCSPPAVRFFGSSAGAFGHGHHPPHWGRSHGRHHDPFGQHGPFGRGGPFGEHGPFGRHGPFGNGGFFGASRSGETSRSVPGSWPEDKKDAAAAAAAADEAAQEDAMPAPGPAAAAKYRAMAEVEAEVERQAAEVERVTSGPQRDALEKVLEELTGRLGKLRVEADEAYAHDLAAKEGWQ